MRQGKGLSVPDCLVWRMEQDQDATAPSDARVLPVVIYPETLERVNVLHLGDNHGNESEGPLSMFRPTLFTAGKNSYPTMARSRFSTVYDVESSITVHKL